MSLRQAQITAMWVKLGYDVRDSKDVQARLVVDNRLILQARQSHGSGKLDGVIQHKIRCAMKLSPEQFDRAIACPLKQPEYFEILRAKGLLD